MRIAVILRFSSCMQQKGLCCPPPVLQSCQESQIHRGRELNENDIIGQSLAGEWQFTALQHEASRPASELQALTLTVAPRRAGGCRHIADEAEALQAPCGAQA